jgi:hypothetical protein
MVGDLDLIELFAADQRRRKLGEGTVRARSDRLRTIERDLAPFGSFGSKDLERWFAKRGHSDNTRRSYLDTLGQFFKWGIDRGDLQSDPTVGVVRPQANGDRRQITREQVETPIANAKKPSLRLWLTLCAFQGLGCQDIARLTFSNLDLTADTPTLRLEDQPNALRVTSTLHEQVYAAATAAHLPSRGRLFPRDSSESVSQKIGRHFKGVGIPGSATSLIWWYRVQAQELGPNFERSVHRNGVIPALDGTAFEADLFEHVRVLVENEDWEKVPREAAVFVEDRLREWSKPTSGQGRGSVEVFKLAVSDEKFPLGGTASERQGWQQLFAGFALAIRNDAGHKLSNHSEMKRHAVAILGTASLLLGQLRHEYGSPPARPSGV